MRGFLRKKRNAIGIVAQLLSFDVQRAVLISSMKDDFFPPSQAQDEVRPGRSRQPRQFVGVMFECCDAYGRLYPNRQRSAFVGRCPRCYRMVTVPVSDDGADTRFFRG